LSWLYSYYCMCFIVMLQWQKAHMIGYYETDQSDEYKTFERVASVLRHDCNFHAATG